MAYQPCKAMNMDRYHPSDYYNNMIEELIAHGGVREDCAKQMNLPLDEVADWDEMPDDVIVELYQEYIEK